LRLALYLSNPGFTPGPLPPAIPAAAAEGGVDEPVGAQQSRPTPPVCPAASLADGSPA